MSWSCRTSEVARGERSSVSLLFLSENWSGCQLPQSGVVLGARARCAEIYLSPCPALRSLFSLTPGSAKECSSVTLLRRAWLRLFWTAPPNVLSYGIV